MYLEMLFVVYILCAIIKIMFTTHVVGYNDLGKFKDDITYKLPLPVCLLLCVTIEQATVIFFKYKI